MSLSPQPALPELPGMTADAVDVFSPEGQKGKIPRSNLEQARSRGFKVAIPVTSPEGTSGYVPFDKIPEAQKRGFQVRGVTEEATLPGPPKQAEGSPGWRGAKGFAEAPLSLVKGLANLPSAISMATSPAAPALLGLSLATADARRREAGRSLAYRGVAALGQGLGLVDPTSMEDKAEIGDTAGILGQGLGSATIGATLGVQAKRGMRGARPELETTGLKNVETALATPGGKAGQRATQMRVDLDTAKAHLSKIQSDAPLSQSIWQRIARKGDPEWFSETAGNIADYKTDLWERNHTAPVGRHVNEPMTREMANVREKALGAIRGQYDLPQSRLAQQWIDRELPRIKTLGDVDERIRILNDELENISKDKYGPVGAQVRLATVKALREAEDNHLESVGEQGVKQSNREWGALDNIENRLRERYFQETGKAAKKSPFPEWVHPYVFAHPGGMAVGGALRVSRMMLPEASRNLATGMRQLGRTGLEPPTLPTRPQPYGLLGPARPTLPELGTPEMPNEYSSLLGTIGEETPRLGSNAPAITVRDPRGRMRRQYLGRQ